MDLTLVIPELVLTVMIFMVFGVDLFLPKEQKHLLGPATAICLVFIAVLEGTQDNVGSLYGGLYRVDTYTHFFRLFFPLIMFFVTLISLDYARGRLRYLGEYYGLLLMATLAMMLMAGAGELITAYVSLELLNFCLYVLTAYAKDDFRSNEAGVKYIILSGVASAFLLYGITFLYGITGTTSYDAIANALFNMGGGIQPGLLIGLVLITAGLGFKVAAVPFHMWTPDVYEGAPTPVTALIAVASKAAGFALLLRLLGVALLPVAASWEPLLALIAAVTMTLGNLVAIQQRNIKRLLAYSSIAQVGYLLMGLAALSQFSASGIIFHVVGYGVTNLAAFLCVIVYQNMTQQEEIEQYAGLAQRAPFMALGLTIALFSLSGLPLFAGFTTKFYLFTAVAANGYLWLVSLAVVNSLISLYYYLKVIRTMYVSAPAVEHRLVVPGLVASTLAVLVFLVVVVGIYPGPLVDIINVATDSLKLPS